MSKSATKDLDTLSSSISSAPTLSTSSDYLIRNATAALPIIKLSRKNYLTWYPKFRLALKTVDLWTFVSGETAAPIPVLASSPTEAEKVALDSWKQKDRIACLLIMRSIKDDFKVDILEMKTATAMCWTRSPICHVLKVPLGWYTGSAS